MGLRHWEIIKTCRVADQHLVTICLGDPNKGSLDCFLRVGKRTLVVRIVVTPHQTFDPGEITVSHPNLVVGKRQCTLAAQVLAGPKLEARLHPHVPLLLHLVESLQHKCEPPDAALH